MANGLKLFSGFNKPSANSMAKRTFWLNKLKLVEPGEWLYFFPGDYSFPGEEHSKYFVQYETTIRQGNRYVSVPCTCYNGSLDKKCAICEHNRQTMMNPDIEVGMDTIRINAQAYFNVLRLGWFHQVDEQYKDKKGNLRVKKVLKKCRGDNCKLCKQGAQKVFGEHKYFKAGWGYLNGLLAIDHELSRHCACGGIGTPTEFVCPTCGDILASAEDLTEEQVETLWKADIECPEDGVVNPIEILECNKCGADMHSMDIYNSAINMGFVKASEKSYALLLKQYGGEINTFVVEKYGEAAFTAFNNLINKPFDFKTLVGVESYKEQLSLFGGPDPYKKETSNDVPKEKIPF